MQVYAEENDISIVKIKQHFRFLCFLILTCERKPFLGTFYLNYPSNTIIKIRKELDKKMTNILFAEETLLQWLTCSTQIPRSLKYFSISLDYDLLYL